MIATLLWSSTRNIHTYVQIYTHKYMHSCIHTYISMCVLTYIHTYIHIHTCIHAYIRTYIRTYIHTPTYGTAQFKLYTRVQATTCAGNHVCRQPRVLARLTHAKLQKLVCARTVACNFILYMWDSQHTQHTIDTCYELALGLPHYTYGVTTGTVAVGNELQPLCS